MFEKPSEVVIIFIIACTALILLLSTFIFLVVRKYTEKQLLYKAEIDLLKAEQENAILKSGLEIQEQTFQNISREIHDNIGQKLSLAKLQLRSIETKDEDNLAIAINNIGNAITDLTDLSRTMSADVINANGLVNAIEMEVQQLNKAGFLQLNFNPVGDIVFLDNKKELIIFRIIQEAVQNIVKHAGASEAGILLNYSAENLLIQISDNGKGIIEGNSKGQGMRNMKTRTEMLGGTFSFAENIKPGTLIKIIIPINEKDGTL